MASIFGFIGLIFEEFVSIHSKVMKAKSFIPQQVRIFFDFNSFSLISVSLSKDNLGSFSKGISLTNRHTATLFLQDHKVVKIPFVSSR